MGLIRKVVKRIANHKYITIFCIAYIAVSYLTYKDFGVTSDERVEYESGRYLLTYLTKPTDLKYVSELLNDKPDTVEHRHLPLFSVYSRTYPALLNLLNPKAYFEWFHLQNMIFGLALFVAAYLFLYEYYKEDKKAILAPILLLLTPVISGHIPANPKDIPFAAAYLLGAFLIYHYLKEKKDKQELGRILILGVFFGFIQSYRTVGITLLITYFIFGLLSGKKLKNHVAECFLIFIVSLFIWILNVPYLGSNFFANFISLLSNAAGYAEWDNVILYGGEFLTKTERPWHYLFTYSFYQLPLIILASLFAGIYFVIRKKIKFNIQHPISILTFLVLFNVLLYFILNPVVYNATRHFLYLYGMLVVIAAFLLIEMYAVVSRKKKYFIAGASAAYLFFTLLRMIKLHPYEYVYFNELIGGLRGANYNYELDYWGATYKESAELVAEVVDRNDLKDIKVYACDNQFAVVYYSKFKYPLVSRSKEADIIICDSLKEQLRVETGRDFYSETHPIVKTIKREDTVLGTIRANESLLQFFN